MIREVVIRERLRNRMQKQSDEREGDGHKDQKKRSARTREHGGGFSQFEAQIKVLTSGKTGQKWGTRRKIPAKTLTIVHP